MINCPLEIYSSSGFQDLLLNLRVSLRLPAVQTKGTRHVLSLQLLWMKYFASFSRAKARCLQNACSALGFLQKQGSLQSERVLLDEATPEETSQIRRTLLYLTCKWESQHLPRAWPRRAQSQVHCPGPWGRARRQRTWGGCSSAGSSAP